MKQFSQKLVAVLVLSLIINGIVPQKASAATPKVKLNKTKITLNVGQKTKLKLKNCKKKITWSSSKKKVAAVNNKGAVTAKKKGKTKITAKTGKKKYVCQVTVKEKKKGSSAKASQTPISTQASGPDNTSNVPSTPSGVDVLPSPSGIPDIKESPVPSASATPSGTDISPSPDVTPSEVIEDLPKFLGFKTYEGTEIITNEPAVAAFRLQQYKTSSATEMESSAKGKETEENNIVNKDEMILLKASYENKKRDSIIEIVLNDSDYGKQQIYTTSASVNKILSSDTYFDDERDSYITDVLLQMPKTKSETTRKIEITETCFLRETIGKKGYADLSHARQTSIDFLVATEPIPSYSVYFNFIENNDNGYTLVSLSSNYSLPNTLYIPSVYNGKKVNIIGDTAFDKATIKKLIIPESITKIGINMTNLTAPSLQEIEMKGSVPELGTFALNEEQLDGACRIIVPEKYAYLYKSASGAWQSYTDMTYYYSEKTSEYLLVSTAIVNNTADIPERIEKFPKLTIDELNETPATKAESFHKNIVWNKEQKSVSFIASSMDEQWMSNGGVSLYLDAAERNSVDLASYNYIALDIECDCEVMLKLLSTSEDIWGVLGEYYESEHLLSGRRTIYFNLSAMKQKNVLSVLINGNKRNAPITIYGIEFLKELP